LKELNVEIKNLQGQGYDGTASKNGKFNEGVALIIEKLYIQVHC